MSKAIFQRSVYTLDVTVYPVNHGAKHCELIRKESCLEKWFRSGCKKTYFQLLPNRMFSPTVCREAFIISLGKRNPSKTIRAERSKAGDSLSLSALKPRTTGRCVSGAERRGALQVSSATGGASHAGGCLLNSHHHPQRDPPSRTKEASGTPFLFLHLTGIFPSGKRRISQLEGKGERSRKNDPSGEETLYLQDLDDRKQVFHG